MALLTTIILVPLAAVGILACLPARATLAIKRVALASALINLGLSVFLVVDYLGRVGAAPPATGTALALEYVERVPWLSQLGIEYYLGVDGISVLMIFLTAVVIFCGICVSWTQTVRVKEFFIFLLLLVTGVFGVFAAQDLFLFFLFYEVAVLPMYLLIGIWGTGPKEYSAMKLTLMLMGGSALIVVGILVLYFQAGVTSFSMTAIAQAHVPPATQTWLFPVMFFGFGTLGGLWPFHTWSPDGHASAPTAVSMLHAGVLMKLGGYGCLKTIYLMPQGASQWGLFFMVLTTVNIFYGALVALQKTDLKYITAYSSVSHCGLVLFGLGALNPTAMQGAMIQMFAHGLMTALFFALIGSIYGRTHTRYITEMGGLFKVMPFLGVAYLVGGLAGLGLPGLAGFIAEVQVFVGAFSLNAMLPRLLTILAAASVVTTAVYILRALTRMLYGPLQNPAHAQLTDATWMEKVPLGLLVFLLAFAGLYPGWMIRLIEPSLAPVQAVLIQGAGLRVK